ncbi:Biosynthetic peptidoglycan transglycosylase [bacterium HR08]|nr:Biosynthetic peptidoglycan transglycosylase [bacterium HR08]
MPSRGAHHLGRRWIRRALGLLLLGLLIVHGMTLARIVRLRSANPEMTALMRQRAEEARARGRTPKRVQIWVPYERISPHLVRAVLAGEDPRFFIHHGFDWEQIQEAIRENLQEGEIVRGASTITQQLAKNLFLSTARTPLRKLREAVITVELELLLGKRRILELYLNVIEWGDGIYGAEAAARQYFGISAARLTPEQAAFLAAIIPNPRETYNPARHPQRVERRRRIIQRRMREVRIPARFRVGTASPDAFRLTPSGIGATLTPSPVRRDVCDAELVGEVSAGVV